MPSRPSTMHKRFREYRDRHFSRQFTTKYENSPDGSRDSGYSSLRDPPGVKVSRSLEVLPSLDGSFFSESDDKDSSGDDSDHSPSEPPSPSKKIRSVSTPYPRAPRSNGYNLASCFSVNQESTEARCPRRVPITPNSRSTDRFVPLRDHETSSTERYRTSKEADTLSRPERLLRRGDDSPDPFSRPTRALQAQRAGTIAPQNEFGGHTRMHGMPALLLFR